MKFRDFLLDENKDIEIIDESFLLNLNEESIKDINFRNALLRLFNEIPEYLRKLHLNLDPNTERKIKDAFLKTIIEHKTKILKDLIIKVKKDDVVFKFS